MKEQDKIEGNTTYISVTVCDQGHYGFQSCGNCGCDLDDKTHNTSCPKCKYVFTDNRMEAGFGGSDF